MQLLHSIRYRWRLLRAMPHVMAASWRQLNGRLYYLRNTPSWVVQLLVDLGEGASEKDSTPSMLDVYAEARRERLARIDQGLRVMKNEASPELYELFASLRDSLRIDTGIPSSGRTVVGKTPR